MEKNDSNFKKIKFVLVYILLLNWGVALAKIFYGYFIKSNSMSADGFHSLGDGANNIIGLVGITLAARPVDSDHPYGHKKLETFTALTIAMMLFLICLEVIESAVRKFLHPVAPDITLLSFLVMIITLSINIFVMKYEYAQGKKLKSDILVSDSMHTKSDVLVSSSVIFSLLFSKFGFYVMDPVISLFIAIFIGFSAWKILQYGSKILCDKIALNPEEICNTVLEIKGVKNCHAVRTRGRLDDIKVDLRVHVRNDMHVEDAHELSEKIEKIVKEKFEGVSEVIVHIEPDRHE